MLNANFKKAATAVKTMNKSGNSLFGSLLAFAQEHRTNGHEALKDHFKAQEKIASVEMKVEMGKNSTYKVAKGKLIKAVELGIELVDAKGVALGKTALEEKIKEVEEARATPEPVKSDFDKFQIALNTAAQLADKVDAKDCAIAAGLVGALYKKLADRMPMPVAA